MRNISAANACDAVLECINLLLYADVIDCTIGVMSCLSNALRSLQWQALPENEQEQLRDMLLNLSSESIREALHKGELPITNGIIRQKNKILAEMGVEIPEGHREINPADYPNYNW